MAIAIPALIISSVIGGITSYMQTKASNKAAKAQAQQVLNNVRALQDEIDKGEVDLEAAMVRIDSLISTTKGSLKGIMEGQVDSASKNIKEQYRKGLAQTMGEIRSELGSRRLFGSGFGQEVRAKTTEGLQKQASSSEEQVRERALAEISKQMTQLDLQGGLMKEGERKDFRSFRLGALNEMMQLQNLAGTLESQAEGSPGVSAFTGGLESGLSNIVGQLTTPDHSLKETPTDSPFSGKK